MLAHLADVSIRSVLLALVAAIALWTLRSRRTAALEHAVWTSVVCGMLALFAFGQFLPRLPLRVLDSPASGGTQATPSDVASPMVLNENTETAQLPESVNAKPADWQAIVVFTYAAVALGFLLRFATGMFLVRRLVAKSNLAGNFSESELISVPSTVGWLRPRILLPLGWRAWEREKLDAVLTHESAHVRRRDGLVAALAHVNRCVFWFHPLAWMLERKVSILAEQACDESTVAVLGDREKYARLLLEMASVVDGSQGRLRGHVLTMAARSHIRQRIDSLLQEGRTFSRGLSRSAWTALALCGIPIVLCAGAVDLDHQPPLLRLEVPILKIPAPPSPAKKRTEPKRELVARAQTVPAQPAAPQSVPAAAPKFEVAAIRLCKDFNGGPGRGRGGGPPPGDSPGRLRVNCFSVQRLIEEAYGSDANGNTPPRGVPIEGGPAWIDSERYTIEAEAEGEPGEDVMRGPMMRALLEDRFGLKIHRQSTAIPIYALTVAKGGAKLQPFQEGECTQHTPGAPRPAADEKPWCGLGGMRTVRNGRQVTWDVRGTSFLNFSSFFSIILDRPLIDKTGITGIFDFHLEFAPDETTSGMGSPFGLGPDDGSPTALSDPVGGPSIFTAFQQQLGLKIEATKGPGQFLVIDHVERPSEN